MSTTSSETLRGRLLDGRYRIESRIARGGMATVYRALDVRLDRTVAVKVMHAGLGDDDDFTARFVREARAAARLNSPNVVAVFDQGQEANTVYLVMEYVPGKTLRDIVRENAPLRPAKALTLIEQVLTALAAAHEAGLVHRDVKPENVLIATDGRVKVADFGLARAVSSATAATATNGMLIGTVSYLAPELVLNQGADARCDVYACGVLLYELLTGSKPHEGETPIQVAYQHVHEDIPPPSLRMPGLPAYLDALVARATARDRDLRPADAKVMLRHVRRVRSALDAGLHDDEELTEDLAPRLATARLPHLDERDPLLLPPPPHCRPEQTLVVGALQGRELAVPVGVPTAAAEPARVPRPRRRRRSWVLIALVLVLAVAAAFGGWYLGVGRFTSTPDVTGLSRSAAQARIERAGLSYSLGSRQYSETVPAGAVITTDPGAASRIPRGNTVSVTVSKGKQRYAVPTLLGLSQAEAEQALATAHLRPDPVGRYHAASAEGVVFRSAVQPGSQRSPGASVRFFVSKGARPIAIPDLTGQPYSSVRAQLRGLGFRVDRSREHSDTVTAGTVVSQTPDGGTGVRDDTISVVVSTGPALVDVPSVIGLSPQSAAQTLRAAGLRVRVRHDPSYIGGFLVVDQTPGSDGSAPAGSTVTVFVV